MGIDLPYENPYSQLAGVFEDIIDSKSLNELLNNKKKCEKLYEIIIETKRMINDIKLMDALKSGNLKNIVVELPKIMEGKFNKGCGNNEDSKESIEPSETAYKSGADAKKNGGDTNPNDPFDQEDNGKDPNSPFNKIPFDNKNNTNNLFGNKIDRINGNPNDPHKKKKKIFAIQ
jgi:hypothetical protein